MGDAARKVNQWCDEFGIKRRNLEIDPTPNKVEDSKTMINYGALKAELEDLIKVLNANKDSATSLSIRRVIREILIAVIRYESETEKTELNFKQAKNVESSLSIPAKHGFSNVVEVLFENWISPNSHVEPYLHLLPIFNVKSREIA